MKKFLRNLCVDVEFMEDPSITYENDLTDAEISELHEKHMEGLIEHFERKWEESVGK